MAGVTAAAYEVTNVVGFGLRPAVSTIFTPSSTSISCFSSLQNNNNNKKINGCSVSCSLVNKQSSHQVSFSKDENLLIEALIGIQGRGRSASPQQLQVCVYILFPLNLPLNLSNNR